MTLCRVSGRGHEEKLHGSFDTFKWKKVVLIGLLASCNQHCGVDERNHHMMNEKACPTGSRPDRGPNPTQPAATPALRRPSPKPPRPVRSRCAAPESVGRTSIPWPFRSPQALTNRLAAVHIGLGLGLVKVDPFPLHYPRCLLPSHCPHLDPLLGRPNGPLEDSQPSCAPITQWNSHTASLSASVGPCPPIPTPARQH
ncbi:hypothetical protein VTK26DRAFT_1854 [Humicola hyalothermophila]